MVAAHRRASQAAAAACFAALPLGSTSARGRAALGRAAAASTGARAPAEAGARAPAEAGAPAEAAALEGAWQGQSAGMGGIELEGA